MNIFVQDGEEQSNATGLPGNNSDAVLHTSFSSNRSSSHSTSNGDSFSTQASTASSTQASTEPSPQALERLNLSSDLHPNQAQQPRPSEMAYRTILPRGSLAMMTTVSRHPGTRPLVHTGAGLHHHRARVTGQNTGHMAVQPPHPTIQEMSFYAPAVPQQPLLPAALHQPALHQPASLQHHHTAAHQSIVQSPRLRPPYPNHSSLQQPMMQQRSAHLPVSPAVYQPAPEPPPSGGLVHQGGVQQSRLPSHSTGQFSQPPSRLYPTVDQGVGHPGLQHEGLDHPHSHPPLAHTQPTFPLPSFAQQIVPQQALSQRIQTQTTVPQTHQQAAQQETVPPATTKRPTTGQLRIKRQSVLTGQELGQPSVPINRTLQQPAHIPQTLGSTPKKHQAEVSTANQPPAKKRKKESTQQQQITSGGSILSGLSDQSIQMVLSSGSGKERAITEKPADYGLHESFESSTSGIPSRLVHGGIIRRRPEFTDGSEDKRKATYTDTGKQPSRESKTNSENKVSHQSSHNNKRSIDHDMKVNHQNHPIRHSKISFRDSAAQRLRSTKEVITEDDPVIEDRVRATSKQEDERIKMEMKLESRDYEPQPTADDAIKARNGMSNEDIISQLKCDINELKRNEQRLDAAEKQRSAVSEKEIAATGVKIDEDILMDLVTDSIETQMFMLANSPVKHRISTPDFFERISNYPEVIMEIAKFLKPKDLVKLYSISKPFHNIVSSFLAHTMQLAAKTQAPESASVFRFKFYGELCVKDPGLRTDPRNSNDVRLVPSPRWLHMVVHRDKTIRDILALLARQGHRLHEGASLSLKKMWLLMDVATTRQRVQLLHSPYYTDKDIFNMQMFFIKLDMRFNNPYHSLSSDRLRKLMLGQRGLTPLCNLLKRKIGLTEIDVAKIGLRYAYHVDPKHRGMPVLDIMPEEIGVGHLEGWGKGTVHLFRPDELVLREGIRRRLNLRGHLMGMMIWGYINLRTGKNVKVSDEEKYMSESEPEDDEYEIWNDEWESDEWETDDGEDSNSEEETGEKEETGTEEASTDGVEEDAGKSKM